MKAKNFTTCPVRRPHKFRLHNPNQQDSDPARSGKRRSRCRFGETLVTLHIPSRPNVATVELFKGGGYMAVNLEPCYAFALQPRPEKRGEITHFTDASRRRMLDLLAKVLYASLPFWMDLTYPDLFPTSPIRWKRDLEVLAARFLRRWPKASNIWKLEFEPRKSGRNKGKLAPHFHNLPFNVPWEFPFMAETKENYRIYQNTNGNWVTEVFCRGERIGVTVGGQDNLVHWVRCNWYDIVNSGDARHYLAGTRVDTIDTREGSFAYCSKRYVAKPEEVKKLGLKPGRFWGVWNRKCLPLGEQQCYRITQRQAIQLRRFIRRHRRATTPPEKRKWLFKGSGSNAAKGFTQKHYCNADFWMERLPRLLGPLPEPTIAGRCKRNGGIVDEEPFCNRVCGYCFICVAT